MMRNDAATPAAALPVTPAAAATGAARLVLRAHNWYANDLLTWQHARGRPCNIRDEVFVSMPPPRTLRKWEPSMTPLQRLTAFLAAHATRFAINDEGTHVYARAKPPRGAPLAVPARLAPPMPAAINLAHAADAAAARLARENWAEVYSYERQLRKWLCARGVWCSLGDVCAALPLPQCLEADCRAGAHHPAAADTPSATLRTWLAARADIFALDVYKQFVCCVAPSGLPACYGLDCDWCCTSCAFENAPGRARCGCCGWCRAAVAYNAPAKLMPCGIEEQRATAAIIEAALLALHDTPLDWLALPVLGVSVALAGGAHAHKALVIRHGTLLSFLRAHPKEFRLFDRNLQGQCKVRRALAVAAAPVAAAHHRGNRGGAPGGGAQQLPGKKKSKSNNPKQGKKGQKRKRGADAERV